MKAAVKASWDLAKFGLENEWKSSHNDNLPAVRLCYLK
jgi:hypothetical protein